MRKLLVALVFIAHAGCAGLGLSDGLTAADGVVRAACAAYTGNDPREALAALQEAEGRIFGLMLTEASRNADPAVLEALKRSAETTASTLRVISEQVASLAAKAPAECPVPDVVAPEPADAGAD